MPTNNLTVSFSVNMNDTDGEPWMKCLNLHFGAVAIIQLKGIDQLKQVIDELNTIKKEVEENYPNIK